MPSNYMGDIMRIALLVSTLALLVASPQVHAGFALPPPPVGQYRLAFVTSMGTDATSTNIADYNNFVSEAADDAPALSALPTTWTVIGSTEDISATLNTMTDPSPSGDTGVPIYRLDNVKIADHYDDLWDGTLDEPLFITETGAMISGSVWTGTNSSGQGDPSNELGAGMPNFGSATMPSEWITDGSDDSSEVFRLYAISGVLGTAVPEPGAFLFVGLVGGVLGSIALGRKRIAVIRARKS
jgi:hypothetical protein